MTVQITMLLKYQNKLDLSLSSIRFCYIFVRNCNGKQYEDYS